MAFRDTEGRIGLIDEFCPHRRVSLYFGRNEECGLRCIYHGWKFDVAGACIDMMNEPEENDFKHKVGITAYPTCELGGIVWAYLGPAEKMPPLPKFAWTQAPEANRHVTKVIEECNWLQALEGGIDTSHAPILHRLLTETLHARRLQAVQPVRARQGAEAGRRSHRLRLSVRRHPSARTTATTCISAPTSSSCRSIRSARRRSESGTGARCRPHLGADR